MSANYSIQSLTLKEKIGQLFVMGFRGEDASEASEVSTLITEHKPGGVILFDKDMAHHQPVHNIKSPVQVKELTAELQSLSDTALLIGVDQEGGLISRLKPDYGFPETISHQKLGEMDNPEVTFNEGMLIARMLSDSGINLNFAPVVDLAKNPESSIIAGKERSFGKSPEKVIRHAGQFIKGHVARRVITCCKHFPGHGSAKGDTHAGFVDVTTTWDERELDPYANLISKNLCPMIMTAHIFHSGLDAKYPSTLSRNILTGLLRDTLNFDGVIVSDDMQMRAISDHYTLEETLKLGLKAGLDLFCFGNNLLEEQVSLGDAIQIITDLVEKEEINEQRIDESVERILNLKNRFLVD
ncbi:MAG: glycoside hydrolase family 3 protein [Balneolaceae bacterium]